MGPNALRKASLFGLVLALVVAAGCARTKPSPGTPETRGQAAFAQLGCNACHSTDGTAGIGPTLKGLYGSEVTLVGGERIEADEAYIRESILDPDAKTVEGFSPGVMSATISRTSVEQGTTLGDLVAFIKSLEEDHPSHGE